MKENWPIFKISDLCVIKYGKALKSEERLNGDCPVYGSNGIVGYHDKALVTSGSIIIGRKGSIGEVHFSEKPFWPIDTTYYLEIDKKKIFVKWFYRILETLKLKNLNRSAAIPGLNRDDVYRISVPLPPLEDQIRIAAVLTRAEKLIAKRKESIKALDEFLKSIFLEMFGLNDSVYKKWEIEPLSLNTEIVSGVTKGKKYKSNVFRSVPYMRVANVQDGHLNLMEIKTIEITEAEIQQYKLKKGDLLLTEGGDPDKLGRGAVWNDEIDECIHQNHIFRVRAKDTTINPVFLSALMASKYGKKYFLKAAKQTTGIASINSTQLKAFPLIKPPVALQSQFASIVEKVEAIKAKYTQSLSELEKLYGSLSQRAFKGELDLSRVPLEK